MQVNKPPVEKLAELLMMEFEKNELEPELVRYKGDFSTRVLEYCLDNDPAEIIKKMFGLPKLRKVLQLYNITIEKIDNQMKLANHLLQTLGFPIQPEFVGINQAISKAERCYQNIMMMSEMERIGWITDLYNELERILKDVSLFYVRFLFTKELNKSSLESLLKEEFGVSKPLDKLGLGDFISLIRDLNAKLKANEELKNQLQKTFGRPYILSKMDFKILDDVSKHRKFFVHHKVKTPSIKDCENVTANTLTLLETFKTEMIYPNLIRINEIATNRFGVRCIRAEDEDGGLWKIYTNMPLDVSKLYFIHSKTGQVAINPIILEKIDI